MTMKRYHVQNLFGVVSEGFEKIEDAWQELEEIRRLQKIGGDTTANWLVVIEDGSERPAYELIDYLNEVYGGGVASQD
jgi:hypothetical protein